MSTYTFHVLSLNSPLRHVYSVQVTTMIVWFNILSIRLVMNYEKLFIENCPSNLLHLVHFSNQSKHLIFIHVLLCTVVTPNI